MSKRVLCVYYSPTKAPRDGSALSVQSCHEGSALSEQSCHLTSSVPDADLVALLDGQRAVEPPAAVHVLPGGTLARRLNAADVAVLVIHLMYKDRLCTSRCTDQ